MTVGLIWAEAANHVIGRDGDMPWSVPEDMAHFKARTMGGVVVMGRRTWESVPERFRPLDGRRNIVVSRDPSYDAPGAETATSLDDALARAGDGDVWVIGGGQLYAAAIDRADLLEVTEIAEEHVGDTHAPVIDARWKVAASTPWRESRTGARFRVVGYVRA
jgi:dihydrofolate reductase